MHTFKSRGLAQRIWRLVYPYIGHFWIIRSLLAARTEFLHRASDPDTVRRYLATDPSPRLHLGCGPHQLPGWLNSDLIVFRADNVRIDATKEFPLPSVSFDFVFTEHMVEHIPFDGALSAFSESFRILKPGGMIRVSTPDLSFLFSLLQHPIDDVRAEYLQWSCETYLKTPLVNGAVVINNFVRNWGHSFIFDKATLEWALRHAGFVNVIFFPVKQSATAALCNLENTERLPKNFVALESICAEAVKP